MQYLSTMMMSLWCRFIFRKINNENVGELKEAALNEHRHKQKKKKQLLHINSLQMCDE